MLGELRRVLKPGGVLRLGLPDAEKGFNAYLRGDLDYFLIPDEHAKSVGAKLIRNEGVPPSRDAYRCGLPPLQYCAAQPALVVVNAIVLSHAYGNARGVESLS